MVHGIETRHHRQQHLGGADVAGGLVTADVLLAGLQGQAQGWIALGIAGLAHQTTGDLTLVGLAGGEEGGMGPAEAHRHAVALQAAHGDVGAEVTHRRQQHLGEGIHSGGADQALSAGGGEQGSRIPQLPLHAGQLQQQPEGILRECRPVAAIAEGPGGSQGGSQPLGIDRVDRDPQRFGPGGEHRQGLGQHGLVHQVAAGAGAAAHRQGEGHRFGGGGALIEQGCVGDRQTGEFAHQGLEIEQGLEAPLGDLGLIGGVGGVPTRVLQHMALDQGRCGGAVVSEANQAPGRCVESCDGGKLSQGVRLTAGLG